MDTEASQWNEGAISSHTGFARILETDDTEMGDPDLSLFWSGWGDRESRDVDVIGERRPRASFIEDLEDHSSIRSENAKKELTSFTHEELTKEALPSELYVPSKKDEKEHMHYRGKS